MRRVRSVRTIGLVVTLSGHEIIHGATSPIFERGSVHGIVGQNGCGKSTFLRVLAGFISACCGSLLIDDDDVRPFFDRDVALRDRIFLVPQDPPIVNGLTILDNIFLGHEVGGRLHRLDRRRAIAVLDSLLTDLKLDWSLDYEKLGHECIPSEQQKVAVLRVLLAEKEPSFILLDEPTAHLGRDELEAFTKMLRSLAARGVGVILVSHRLEDLARCCDRVSVMESGKFKATLSNTEFTDASSVQAALEYIPPTWKTDHTNTVGEAALRLAIQRIWDTSGRPKIIRDVSIVVRAGEVCSVLGEPNSGISEIFDLLSGSLPGGCFEGEIDIFGRRTDRISVEQLRHVGVNFIPDQKVERGVILELSIQENLLLTDNDVGLWIWGPRADGEVDALSNMIHLHADRLAEPVKNLSGGYQQRVLLARELNLGTRLLIMLNPSQGLDVRTRDELYENIISATMRGAAILLLTSDKMEIDCLPSHSQTIELVT